MYLPITVSQFFFLGTGYTDNTKDEEGNTKVYASVFKPDAEPLELLPVETEREWKIIETIITSITEESKKEKKEDK